ncbi:tetratricopeptide repeat protein [Flavobacterium amniphilum]|uniref:tetratricopeptide repeat protein n=1 Tax=Flavobacterium amniphilum TaxID=1834035 RepID=UPI00202A15C3|nr:tetratricopeptide repeat protein [Flavobacterium amniphilum]MCL9804906.1 tetratricopeptide repeat protein [Flavobacterium amniphilum]
MIMIRLMLFLILFSTSSCNSQSNSKEKKIRQEEIIKEHLEKGAWRHMMFSKEWQENIDLGLKKDSTIAYLWQQKAMPYFKLRKYEIGMPLIDKAVKYDAQRWQPYRAFIKCIFAKTYTEAIADFEDCKKKFGNNYEMDHTYNFYIALCKLQLNQYDEAEKLLSDYINEMLKKNGEDWVHPTALFYYGISKYEQQKWVEAIHEFDRTLKSYPNFSDVKFYKALCLMRLNKEKEAKLLFEEGEKDAKTGYTINEDNAVYEKYPYQVIWK